MFEQLFLYRRSCQTCCSRCSSISYRKRKTRVASFPGSQLQRIYYCQVLGTPAVPFVGYPASLLKIWIINLSSLFTAPSYSRLCMHRYRHLCRCRQLRTIGSRCDIRMDAWVSRLWPPANPNQHPWSRALLLGMHLKPTWSRPTWGVA